MIDPAPRLAPRSVVPIADLELLRVARADLGDPAGPAAPSAASRIRGLARFGARRRGPDAPGPALRLGKAGSR